MQTRKDFFSFRGHLAFPETASGVGTPWVKADTSSSGSPTIGGSNAGGVKLLLAATNEAENLCLYFGDVLAYDIDDLIRVEMVMKASASLDSSISAAFGMASARNDTLDSVAAHAWFRLQGSNALLVETDDGTTDNDDKATGLSLSTTWTRLAIDFSMGGNVRNPPSTSQGGLADVRFFAGNGNGSLRRVAADTRFDMSAYSSGLQPIFQLQKTAGTPVGSIECLDITVEYRLPC